MNDAGVVLDGVGLALHTAHVHGGRGVELVSREPFVFEVIANIYFVKYYVLASATLLYFDHAITFPLEVRRVWGARFTGASALFYLNRYILFFGFIPILLSLFNPPWDATQVWKANNHWRCDMFGPVIGALSLVSNVVSAAILILRTYALYGRALWVLILTGSLGAASIGVGAWSVSAVKGEIFSFKPLVVCVPMVIDTVRSVRFTWILTFVFDFVVFALTIVRTFRVMKNHVRLQMQSNLYMLLMRDGSLYFLVMSIVNGVNFILAVRINNPFFAQASGTNSILATTISVIMLSRLLLNLREESFQHSRRSSGRTSDTTTPSLTDTNLIFSSRIIGNLTADLDFESPASSRARGSDNYYSYGYGDESSDELYELQSLSTRSGFTSRSGYSGRTELSEPGSSTGTGTIAGSASGSGSGTDSDKAKVEKRGHPKLAWAPSTLTTPSAGLRRAWLNEPHTPDATVETRAGLLGSSERSQPNSPLTLGATNSRSPALYYPPPLSPHPHSLLARNHGRESLEGVVDGEEWEEEGNSDRAPTGQPPLRLPGLGGTIELSRHGPRSRGPDSSHEHDLHHDHYRPTPSSRPES